MWQRMPYGHAYYALTTNAARLCRIDTALAICGLSSGRAEDVYKDGRTRADLQHRDERKFRLNAAQTQPCSTSKGFFKKVDRAGKDLSHKSCKFFYDTGVTFIIICIIGARLT